MTRWILPPAFRPRRILVTVAIALVVSPMVLYLALLAAQAYAYRQADRALSRLEAIRIGDPKAAYESAVKEMRCERKDDRVDCRMYAGTYRSDKLQYAFWKLPERWAYPVFLKLPRLGLGGWILGSSAQFRDNAIVSLSVAVFVHGRNQSLATDWSLASTIPRQELELYEYPSGTPTLMRWTHVTSVPSGEGYRFFLTPRSSEKELLARVINRRCLQPSIHPCEGLCELIPNVIPLLAEKEHGFGGCTSAPPAPCEPSNDCRKFREN